MTHKSLADISPTTLQAMLEEGSVTLIDVREPDEFASARIKGALLAPLSTFDAKSLPHDPARPIVLQCGSGKRSATAASRCAAAGVPIAGHLAGGLGAWMAARLPTLAIDPATGKMTERN